MGGMKWIGRYCGPLPNRLSTRLKSRRSARISPAGEAYPTMRTADGDVSRIACGTSPSLPELMAFADSAPIDRHSGDQQQAIRNHWGGEMLGDEPGAADGNRLRCAWGARQGGQCFVTLENLRWAKTNCSTPRPRGVALQR